MGLAMQNVGLLETKVRIKTAAATTAKVCEEKKHEFRGAVMFTQPKSTQFYNTVNRNSGI